MPLPLELILVRHGESEFNIASKRAKKGDKSDFEGEFGKRHGSKWRLTDEGRRQAKVAGEWLRNDDVLKHLGNPYSKDGFFVSSFVRAMETAAHLDIEGASWKVSPYLRERDYGNMESGEYLDSGKKVLDFRETNPLYGSPPNGESLVTVQLRADRVLNTLSREYANQKVVLVCHGEFMWAMRMSLEKITEERFEELNASQNPHDHIWNCHVLHYTRSMLPNGHPVQAEKYTAMRSVCPWNPELSSNEWKAIVRKKFSNEDLLSFVNQYPLLVPV